MNTPALPAVSKHADASIHIHRGRADRVNACRWRPTRLHRALAHAFRWAPLAGAALAAPLAIAATPEIISGQQYSVVRATQGATGANGAPASSGDGGAAGSGTAAPDVNVQLDGTALVSGGGVNLRASGGSGGIGGPTSADHHDGGSGGGGGSGGAVSLSLLAGSVVSGIANSGAIWLSSLGGNGGLGGQNAGTYGKFGAPGAGGSGGLVVYYQDDRTGVFSTVAGQAAITLSSVGGNGEDAGGAQTSGDPARAHDGAAGGTAGVVRATDNPIDPTRGISGTILSAGSGVVATSLGGNGGVGGNAIGATGAGTATGGNGGAGGNGAAISLAIGLAPTTITAKGAATRSDGDVISINGQAQARLSTLTAGVLAVSRGGIGQSGGTSNGFFNADAGKGGAAGNGAQVVIIDTAANVITTGYGAAGLIAQSVGGAAGSGSSAQSYLHARGGSGGPGGNGGIATVYALDSAKTPLSAVITSGEDADGIVAQSIGGGGGWGGDVRVTGIDLALGVGGLGGAGGSSSGADVHNVGTVISTHGDSANGIVAQSIAGGGGRGGDASAVSLGGYLALAIGGSGGAGGTSGSADVSQKGVVQTRGAHAVGVMAQSIAGGGGAGGGANSLSAGSQLTVAVAVGGSGGAGGNSALTTVTNDGQVATGGTDAYGILAQSISGGGGHGGGSVASAYQLGNAPDIPSLTLKVSVGGSGGNAGTAGGVNVDNHGVIFTTGGGATGVLAQSVAGSGGAGGDAGAFGQALMTSTINVTTTIGGPGGNGGTSGDVKVGNAGFIGTLSRDASGISAQSIAGGGGNGGFSESNSGTFGPDDNKKSLQLTVNVGGSGGPGGQAGNVSVTNSGGILTLGDNSHGIAAQSVAGGGGNGGMAIAGGTGGSVNINLAVGGSGGDGRRGGAVLVTNAGSIMTTGGQSHAIFAQSVGGGGGSGGNAATSGGRAAETSAFDYIAKGMGIGAGVVQGADGVYSLQGNYLSDLGALDKLKEVAKNYVNGEPTPTPSPSQASKNQWTLDIGGGVSGSGGMANDGGTVTVANNGGALLTQGAGANGIFAQSVGGGGGTAGIANGSTSNALFNFDPAGAFSIGGAGGVGGNGGHVTIASSGSIDTTSDAAFGIHAQSIGGGGGAGGLSMSQVGTIKNLAVSLGGRGGASGNGGVVSIDLEPAANGAHTVTAGRDAIAVLAQSIGGGGGVGVLYGVEGDGAGGRGSSHTSALSLPNFALSLNGAGGASGNGGAVTATLGTSSPTFGFVQTGGIDAYGILAQSIGGGGGLFIGAQNATSNQGNDALNALFAKGRGAGHGGAVDVEVGNGFNVATYGAGAIGILAQSIGGGGGLIGGMHNVDLGQGLRLTDGTLRNDGQGGDVSVKVGSGAVIATRGANASAIVAQSLGGGGGVLDQPDGSGFAFASASRFLPCGQSYQIVCTGKVSVSVDAGSVVEASGTGTYAVLAQSQGNGTNEVEVTVGRNALVRSVGPSLAAIRLGGADRNTLNVLEGGTVEHLTTANQPEPQGLAVDAREGATINNSGTIIGRVFMGAGSTLRNAPTGVLSTVGTLELGAGSSLENAGVVDIAGQNGGTLRVHGNYTQTATGRLVVDVDTRHHRGEVLSVDGNARLGGTIAIRASTLSPDSFVVAKSEGSGALLLDHLTVTGVGGGGTFTYSAAMTDEGLSVTPQANLRGAAAAQGFGSSRQSAATHLEAGFNADLSDQQSRVFAQLANLDSAEAYGKALDSLSGQVIQTVGLARRTASVAFSERLNMSNCGSAPVIGELAQERDCAWTHGSSSSLRRRADRDGLGYQASSQAGQFGWQRRLADDYALGIGVSFDHGKVDADDGGGSVRGNTGTVAATLKRDFDRVAVSFGVDVGHGDFSSERHISLGEIQETATGSFGMWHTGLHGRIAYWAPQDGWYLKPYLDAHALLVRTGSFKESGSADLGLQVDSATNTLYSVSPMLEVGGKRTLRDGLELGGFTSVGALLLHDHNQGADARLAGWRNAGSSRFQSTATLPSTQAKLIIGASLSGKNTNLALDYTSEIASGYLVQSVSIKLDHRF